MLKSIALMKIKNTLTAGAFLLLIIGSGLQVLAADPFKIDTKNTTIKWTGEKVTGKHYGKISVQSGNLVWEGNLITGGQVSIDMNSITCEDLTDATWNNKLIGHLKSDDFFAASKFPTSNLVIKKSMRQGDKLMIIGDLTIKGITKTIEFMADVKVVGNTLSAQAQIIVNRSEFNVRYGSSSFFDNLGDKVISDNFSLEISLKASK
jgi:polyisoprenoid-binding protein YceI